MKTLVKNRLIAIIAFYCLAQLINSCSILGLGIGASVDKKNKALAKIEAIQITEINRGNKIELFCVDGRIVKGIYHGTSQLPQHQYAVMHSAFVDLYSNDSSIPKIGDTVKIFHTKSRSLVKGKFVAVETDKMELESLDFNKRFTVAINTTDNAIYHNNKPFIAENYDNLPRITIIQLKDENNTISDFLISEIDYILVDFKYNARLIGALIGMPIDVAIITSIILYYSSPGISVGW